MDLERTPSRRPTTYSRRPHLWRRSARGPFYIVWQEGARTRKLSTKTDRRAIAERVLDEFLEEFDGTWLRPTPITLHDGVSEWLADRERPRQGLQASTLAEYRTFASKFHKGFPTTIPAHRVTPAMIRQYLDKREDGGIAPQTLKKELIALSMVFRFLNREGRVRGNPCEAIKIRATTKRHPAMTEEEFATLRGLLAQETEKVRTAMMRRHAQELLDFADVLWMSGLRSIDAVRLTWEDINIDGGAWTIRSPANKGGTRLLPIHDALLPILRRRKLLGGSGPFGERWHITALWRRFKRVHPQFTGWSWHRMRHAFVTRLRRAGLDAAAMELARHRTREMSDHYTHLSITDLKKCLDAL